MSQSMPSFRAWFRGLTGHEAPHGWQETLAREPACVNRLVRIPTGMGKTEGVLTAWTFHRLVRRDAAWPRRLVWCLPMRVLAEQTEQVVRAALDRQGLLWDGGAEPAPGCVGVHLLMGGETLRPWHLYPEVPAVLIGTQDMLLSRALNRGYAAPRGRWPMEFGLLNQDALWVMDEVQVMDVGLATSAQLQAFRENDTADGKGWRPCKTWWMSATLQPDWLESVDTKPALPGLADALLAIPPRQRTGPLWEGVSKPLRLLAPADEQAVAEQALSEHARLADGPFGRVTLVVANRVERACDIYRALLKAGRAPEATRLLHSRFRGAERNRWVRDFLSRAAFRPGQDLIVVATQVIEAGVDISAGCLITDLAPWPSLVQRLGRAARYGGKASVTVVDLPAGDAKAVLPYETDDLDAARAALRKLKDGAPCALEAFEEGLSDTERGALYPYQPRTLLLRKEVEELFDTTPDLTGADLDISRFIRSNAERDCLVFWGDWGTAAAPDAAWQPPRDALCSVPVYRVHQWLCEGDTLKEQVRAFVFDFLDDAWRPARRPDLYPGRLVWVHPDVGGYDVCLGFTGEKPGRLDAPVPPVAPVIASRDDRAAAGQDNEALAAAEHYQSIAAHDLEVARLAVDLMRRADGPEGLAPVLDAAGRFHDLGKAHPVFQARIVAPDRPAAPDVAKAPERAWQRSGPRGFRHELASALALLELLARADQDHPALLGACRPFLDAGVLPREPAEGPPVPQPLADEWRGLSAPDFNLLLYLVAAHHGKVRAALHACPADQETDADSDAAMPIRGVRDGDCLPPVRLPDWQGNVCLAPAVDLHLAPARLGLSARYGPSWRERTLDLQSRLGPFALAWLEALLRAADVRASMTVRPDPLLPSGGPS